ncbi:hypothetical protein GGI17_006676, partial [Coemansia sp. S146]
MSEPPDTDNPGTQPERPETNPGQSYVVAVLNGQAQAGGAGRGAVAPAGQGALSAPKLVKFSTFNTLSGGELSYKELPPQVVGEIPYTRYCAYDIPIGISKIDWMTACFRVPTTVMKQTATNLRTNIGIVAVSNDEDLAILEATTLMVKGKPVPHKRIVVHKDSLVYVYISGLDAAPFESLTRDIYDALSFYGTILDIEFEALGNCSTSKARALIDVTATSIPGVVWIRGKKLNLSGKTVELRCTYCKESGHPNEDCPKKGELYSLHAAKSSNEANAAVSQVNINNRNTTGSRNIAVNRNNEGSRNSTGNRNNTDSRENSATVVSDESPPPKKNKRPRTHKQSVARPQANATTITAAAPTTPTPGFITSFVSPSTTPQSAIHNGMAIVLNPPNSPARLAASGSSQPGAMGTRKGGRSNTLPGSMSDPTNQSNATPVAPGSNNNQ